MSYKAWWSPSWRLRWIWDECRSQSHTDLSREPERKVFPSELSKARRPSCCHNYLQRENYHQLPIREVRNEEELTKIPAPAAVSAATLSPTTPRTDDNHPTDPTKRTIHQDAVLHHSRRHRWKRREPVDAIVGSLHHTIRLDAWQHRSSRLLVAARSYFARLLTCTHVALKARKQTEVKSENAVSETRNKTSLLYT